MATSQSTLPRVNTSFLPILLKGHERSITTVKYNGDGDLIFTAAKDQTPTVWYADTGERLGTYGYHRGACLDIDPSWDSKHVITACADGSARLFDATSGEYLARMPHKGAVRACAWGESTRLFATAADPFHSRERGSPDPKQDPARLHLPKHEIEVDDNDKAVSIGWTIADQHIIAGFDSGIVVKYDAETGQEVARNTKMHLDRVNRLTFNRDKTLFVTASKDCYAKLVDPNNLEVIKEYKTDRPVNGAFESRFFHMIYAEEFGRVKGHFGPINALSVHPFGKSFASGSEDGFIRVHRFEASYLNSPDLIPHDLKKQ
eukprot:GSChrysophyteH2.ASY1.ANO1.884.1 assembled CDS